jgi:3-oxoacyl-[acyl-carrier protein] reductase
MIDLAGKVALITGGSRGIGASCSILFAKSGCDIAFTYKSNKLAADKIKSQVEALGRKCLPVKCEISSFADVKNCIKEIIEYYSKIDILVNNAGIWTYGEIGNMEQLTWQETMNVNLNSVYYFCNEVVPFMKKHNYGRIINVTSTAGQRGEAYHSHYAASKGAVISFTKSLSSELAKDNILVNSVAPGWVDTDMCNDVFSDKEYKEQVKKGIPIGRIPTPDDIAGPILFLASDLARHITGEILNVNGGSVLCG